MKKIIFTIVTLSICNLSNSQIRSNGQIELAPSIGVLSSNYFGDCVGILNQPKTSATFGVQLDYFFNDLWSLKSGVEYQILGSDGPMITFNNERYHQKLNYITVPIHANLHFGSTKKWYLNFGPSISYLTSAFSNEKNITYAMKRMQFGLGFGIGYNIYINPYFSIGIDHQEYIGLSKILKKEYFKEAGDSMYNYLGSFSVKAIFKIPSKTTE